jgi:hypothetical protein
MPPAPPGAPCSPHLKLLLQRKHLLLAHASQRLAVRLLLPQRLLQRPQLAAQLGGRAALARQPRQLGGVRLQLRAQLRRLLLRRLLALLGALQLRL